MPARKKKKAEPPPKPFWHVHMPKIMAAVLGLGATGGTAITYSHGTEGNERAAVVETKVKRAEEDIALSSKKIDRVDRRTVRIETQMQDIADKLGVKHRHGPEEENK